MAILRLVSFLVLLLLGLHPFGICEPDNREASAAPITQPPPHPAPLSTGLPDFNSFLLALTWPNAFCKQKNITCDPSKPPQQFTIHGLWPQKNNTSNINCNTTDQMTDAILESKRQDLLNYWPALRNANNFTKSIGLWRYQWKKHGSCSSNKFTPAAYLTAAINLAKNYRASILTQMEKAGIKPDGTTLYTKQTVLNAIQNATGKIARIATNNDTTGELQLYEIRLCVDADGIKLLDCKSSTDNSKFIFASAPTGFFNLISSSILKVEEAVAL